jgi:hypothetical protein
MEMIAMRKILSALVICTLGILQASAAVAPGDDFNASAASAAESLQRWYNPQDRRSE